MLNIKVSRITNKATREDCDACESAPDYSLLDVWSIEFMDVGTVSLCRAHINHLTDALALIMKHKVEKSSFTL